mmetsp:Transcript_13859/g.20735  ORF Transcript_13859/g.20735 Transcript_13859/m.20735 type:complete len:100 (+) Transcript_13859:328-627(+)
MKEIRNDQLESIDSDYLDPDSESSMLPEKIYGSPYLQSRNREVLIQYEDTLRLEIPKDEPAKLEPLELEVRNPSETWVIPANKLSPRKLDWSRLRELQR